MGVLTIAFMSLLLLLLRGCSFRTEMMTLLMDGASALWAGLLNSRADAFNYDDEDDDKV